MLLMSPSMPSGGVLDADDWAVVAELCVAHNLLLIVDSAMERLLFDGRTVLHPAGLPGMAEAQFDQGGAGEFGRRTESTPSGVEPGCQAGD